MFNDVYKLDKQAGQHSIIDLYSNNIVSIKPGVYNSGLLTVIDDMYASKIVIETWSKSIPEQMSPIAYSAFGDLFLADKNSSLVSLFEPQYDRLTNIEIGLKEFVDKFLVDQEIIDNLIKRNYMEQIQKLLPSLSYGECYILKPWIMTGGEDIPENYVKGDFSVYFELVGQTYHHE